MRYLMPLLTLVVVLPAAGQAAIENDPKFPALALRYGETIKALQLEVNVINQRAGTSPEATAAKPCGATVVGELAEVNARKITTIDDVQSSVEAVVDVDRKLHRCLYDAGVAYYEHHSH